MVRAIVLLLAVIVTHDTVSDKEFPSLLTKRKFRHHPPGLRGNPDLYLGEEKKEDNEPIRVRRSLPETDATADNLDTYDFRSCQPLENDGKVSFSFLYHLRWSSTNKVRLFLDKQKVIVFSFSLADVAGPL